MTTFQDVEDKYYKSHRYIYLNLDLALENNLPMHDATWLHKPTLARWLYNASEEWIKDYNETVGRLTDKSKEQEQKICTWRNNLIDDIIKTKMALSIKFYNDTPLMEALSK